VGGNILIDFNVEKQKLTSEEAEKWSKILLFV